MRYLSKFYEEHADSVELWSPANPLFPEPEVIATGEEWAPGESLRELLTGVGCLQNLP